MVRDQGGGPKATFKTTAKQWLSQVVVRRPRCEGSKESESKAGKQVWEREVQNTSLREMEKLGRGMLEVDVFGFRKQHWALSVGLWRAFSVQNLIGLRAWRGTG